MPYLQHAQGEFTIDVAGDTHCGPDHTTPKRFQFEVNIHYPDHALDSNGFLLDNLYFQGYFQGLGQTALSCELLCKTAAEELHNATMGRAESTSVAIWAIPGHAKIVHTLKAPERHFEWASV